MLLGRQLIRRSRRSHWPYANTVLAWSNGDRSRAPAGTPSPHPTAAPGTGAGALAATVPPNFLTGALRLLLATQYLRRAATSDYTPSQIITRRGSVGWCRAYRRVHTVGMDREAIHRELEEARTSFHQLVAGADGARLRRLSNGTRWTNKQLLFHMLLGFLILRALRRLVLLFSRLPDGVSQSYARLLNKATRPFDTVNYLGSRLGGNTLSAQRMAVMFDHVIAKLHRRVDAESDADLARGCTIRRGGIRSSPTT